MTVSPDELTVDRRSPTTADRRSNSDRREMDEPVAEDRRQGDRRKVPRRRQIDPTTCERDYTDPEIEFMQALDAYKRTSGRMFPTCSEILEVIRDLGYVRSGEEDRVEDQPLEDQPSDSEPLPADEIRSSAQQAGSS